MTTPGKDSGVEETLANSETSSTTEITEDTTNTLEQGRGDTAPQTTGRGTTRQRRSQDIVYCIKENLRGLNEARLAQQMTRQNDDFHHFGMMVAERLRKMPRLQALRAMSVVQQQLLNYEEEHLMNQ
ncbi:uncharacterized protein LOC115326036 [Ixodes scapularis]|uniref:uncharacterized protein LOC115326036 n=1 Tax=Ixodes scapularis TaxID=6945 RepID=UPI0011618C78|nr:uncharacterized protein LOC115326036 [Ixodes scapularis]